MNICIYMFISTWQLLLRVGSARWDEGRVQSPPCLRWCRKCNLLAILQTQVNYCTIDANSRFSTEQEPQCQCDGKIRTFWLCLRFPVDFLFSDAFFAVHFYHEEFDATRSTCSKNATLTQPCDQHVASLFERSTSKLSS